MKILFRPKKVIRRKTSGRLTTLFKPEQTYYGSIFSNGEIVGTSPELSMDIFELQEDEIEIIERFPRKGWVYHTTPLPPDDDGFMNEEE